MTDRGAWVVLTLNGALVGGGWWLATPGSLVPQQLLVAHAGLALWAALAWTAGQPLLRIAALLALATSLSLKSPRIDALALGALVTALTANRLAQSQQRIEQPEPALPRGRWLGPAAALALTAIAALASQLLFEGAPHVADSAAQWFHARILAGGAVAAPLPALPESVAQQYVIADTVAGRWYSLYPPGHVAALAVGMAVGVPWLVNPVLGGVAVLAFDRVARRHLGDGSWAAGATLSLALSPMVVFMSAEAMNHSSALAATCALLYASLRLHQTPMEGRWWWASGAAASWCALARPVTALAIALPLLASALWHGRRSPGVLGRSLAGLAVPALVGLGLLVAWQIGTTADPWVSGYARFFATAGPPVAETGWRSAFTRLAQTTDNAAAFNVWALGWPAPALLLAWVGARRVSATPFDRAIGLAVVALAVVHAPYFYQDLCFGPRFWFEATPAVTLLAVAGLRELAGHWRLPVARWAMPALLLCALAVNAVLARTLYARPDWWGPWSSAVARAAAAPGLQRTVVVVRGEAQWRGVGWRNDPWLKTGPVFVRDSERADAAVRLAFPGWRVVRLGGDR